MLRRGISVTEADTIASLFFVDVFGRLPDQPPLYGGYPVLRRQKHPVRRERPDAGHLERQHVLGKG